MEAQSTEPGAWHLFKGPAAFAALAIACFAAALVGGIGPCGGLGILFLFPCFLFVPVAIIWFLISCGRLFTRRRSTHDA